MFYMKKINLMFFPFFLFFLSNLFIFSQQSLAKKNPSYATTISAQNLQRLKEELSQGEGLLPKEKLLAHSFLTAAEVKLLQQLQAVELTLKHATGALKAILAGGELVSLQQRKRNGEEITVVHTGAADSVSDN